MAKSKQTDNNYYYSKTTYLLFDKQPHGSTSSKLSLHINEKEIFRNESVKYLGVWFELVVSSTLTIKFCMRGRFCSLEKRIRNAKVL